MATIEQFERVERDFLKVAREAGLPEPDEIGYHDDTEEVEFIWHEHELVVVVEIDEHARRVVPEPPV